ncbi:MAG TPA: hypothetical protein VK612_12470 [Pyrinomonadaceae bacterium]|nr:hypothetical protein [Pyrinomonadaceae bacterium]
MPPAARVADNVMHPLPPVLTPGPGSMDVLIGFMPAWRGIPAAAAAALKAAKQIADTAITVAETATKAAAGTPGAPAAYAAEQAAKTAAGASLGAMASSLGAMSDIHSCIVPSPVPPHGPGLVIDGSASVLTNNMPQSRMGDTVLEPLGPPNKIVKGFPQVMVGN